MQEQKAIESRHHGLAEGENMPKERGELSVRRLQQAIEQIRGVDSARVVLDDENRIAEIHLAGSSTRRPKQIVRDTESLLHARFGIHVDYRKISLVQLDGNDRSSARSRLELIAAAPNPSTGDSVEVILQNDGKLYEGMAPIQARAQGSPDAGAVARATVRAVQKAIGDIACLTIQEAKKLSADGQQVVLVVIHAATSQGEEYLTGTCIAHDNAFEAAAKATLDAINRRWPVWYSARGAEQERDSSSNLAHN